MKGDLLFPIASSFTLDDMPNDSMVWLASEIGLEGAIKILLHFSGTEIYSPISTRNAFIKKYIDKVKNGIRVDVNGEMLISAAHIFSEDDMTTDALRWIAENVSTEAAVKVVANLSGARIYAPIESKLRLKRRYCQMNYNGSNARALAMLLDVAERTIYKWASLRSEPSSQLDLFAH